ncbi:Sec-independent protein translocase protein TatB [Oleispirillum naphthae]|uniref:Sec-independent protein translocase protein TatB n=1 Tax=Oleispirillum naphthae TaxID=2838853 RepID=UPI00308228F6
MFDIGGWELALVVVVAVFVIGPNELPATLRTLGRVIGRLRALSAGFRNQLDEMIREAELDDLRKAADAARSADFGRIVEDAVDPDRVMRDSLSPDPQTPAEPPAEPKPPRKRKPRKKAAPKGEGEAQR